MKYLYEMESALNRWWGSRHKNVLNYKISEGPLPTNVKWEHRSFSGLKKKCKIIFIYLIALTVMVFTHYLIFSAPLSFRES